MWLTLAFLSAALLGFYDVFKKQSLRDNAVVPVLFLNTLFCALIFLPLIIGSACGLMKEGDMLYVPMGGWETHRYIMLKSCIVLSSWLFGYFAIKHLPLTIVGPVNATRPVLVLIGAVLVFGERLNLYQWCGVFLGVVSFYLLSRSGKKEGISFAHNKWVFFLLLASVLGATSGLYDKFLLSPTGAGLDKMTVQSWYNVYQSVLMFAMLVFLWYPRRRQTTPFRWHWAIPLISIFLTAADFAYFYALSVPGAMISIISMVRRGSVMVSFVFGAMIFREKNLKAKAFDLILIILSMVCLWLGTTS